MDCFTIRDLRDRSGELVRELEAGQLALLTKHGHPLAIALPFNETLLQLGVPAALAIALRDQGVVSTGQAARIAGLSPRQFLALLTRLGSPAHDPTGDDPPGTLQALG